MAAAAVLWAAALPTAAYAASRPAGGGWHVFGLAVYALGSAICHQQPERSFEAFGAQIPVCARCLGIYVGAALSGVGSAIVPMPSMRMHANAGTVRLVLLAAALPALLSLLYEWTTGQVPSNWTRAATGAVLGGTVMLAIASQMPARQTM